VPVKRSQKNPHPVKIALLLLAVTAGLCPLRAQQGDPSAPPSVYSPFMGEKLGYSIDWNPPWYLFFVPEMHAGDAELYISGERDFQGKKVLEIKFEVHSSGMLSKLSGMEVHDELTFLADPETFCTLHVSKKIHEGKRKRQMDVEYLQTAGQLHIVEYDTSTDPPQLKKDKIKDNIPPCVRDPFSALYFLRRQPIKDGFTMTSVIGNDDTVKEVESRAEKLEKLNGTEGKIPAWRIKAIALMGGLFKSGGQFKVWLSADTRQVPLQFEVKVSLGRIFGRLNKIEVPDRQK
jgi:hypothetical protein